MSMTISLTIAMAGDGHENREDDLLKALPDRIRRLRLRS